MQSDMHSPDPVRPPQHDQHTPFAAEAGPTPAKAISNAAHVKATLIIVASLYESVRTLPTIDGSARVWQCRDLQKRGRNELIDHIDQGGGVFGGK